MPIHVIPKQRLLFHSSNGCTKIAILINHDWITPFILSRERDGDDIHWKNSYQLGQGLPKSGREKTYSGARREYGLINHQDFRQQYWKRKILAWQTRSPSNPCGKPAYSNQRAVEELFFHSLFPPKISCILFFSFRLWWTWLVRTQPR